ncbi:MAG: glycine betaine ABC transporter substrate-binding protein [Dehalococcoidia bacterium]
MTSVTTHRRLLRMLMAVAAAAVLMLGLAACEEDGTGGENGTGDGGGTVSIAATVWNYDVITTGVLQRALEAEGWTVELEDAFDLGPTFSAISSNDINMYPGYWLPTLHANYQASYPDTIVSIGNIYDAPTPVGLTIPQYTADEHGIVTIGDLQGQADVFRGEIVGYEAGTGGSEAAEAAIVEYGLDGYEFLPSSVPAMLAELESSLALEEPVIIIGYHPHPMFARNPIVMLEDPMGVFGEDSVSHAVNADFADANPDLVSFLENFSIPLLEMEGMLVENEQNGVPEDELAEEWYSENQETIAGWWD